MRLWFDRHSRLRDQLSAYIDGELKAPAAERLERHLADCGRCRAELEQLRATIGALRELPEAEPPRSFTLSPERVAAPRPALPAVPPLAFGMRIAATVVAAALAVVLVVDLGDIGGDGPTEEAAAPQAVSERQADEDTFEATGAAAPDEAEGASPSEPGDDSGTELMAGDIAETPAAGPEEAPEAVDAAKAAEDGDGGIDSLTAAEIGLAAALGIIVAGSLTLAYAGRKR